MRVNEPERQRHDDRRRGTAIGMSLAVHVITAWWLNRIEPPPRETAVSDLAEIDLVDWVEPAMEDPLPPEPPEPEPPRPEPPEPAPPLAPPEPPPPAEAPVDDPLPPGPVDAAPEPVPIPPAPILVEPPPNEDEDEKEQNRSGGLLALRSARPTPPPAGLYLPSDDTLREIAATPRPAANPLDDLPPRSGKPRSLADMGFEPEAGGGFRYRDPKRRFTAKITPDGEISFRVAPVQIELGWGEQAKLRFGGADEASLKAQGKERLRRERQRILDETEEARRQLTIEWTRTRLAEEQRALTGRLDRVWHASASPPERRKRLFLLWDECEESVSKPAPAHGHDDTIDRIRRRAGDEARELIESYIRRKLPAGSQEAFTQLELDELNRIRRSRAQFSPYR